MNSSSLTLFCSLSIPAEEASRLITVASLGAFRLWCCRSL